MGEDEFEKFFDSITPAGSYDAHDPTHRALRYTQEIAWRAGREQGMREAAGICQSHTPKDFTTAGIMTRAKCAEAILSAIEGKK